MEYVLYVGCGIIPFSLHGRVFAGPASCLVRLLALAAKSTVDGHWPLIVDCLLDCEPQVIALCGGEDRGGRAEGNISLEDWAWGWQLD